MSVAWFTAIYVIWSMYLRHDAPYPGGWAGTNLVRCWMPSLMAQWASLTHSSTASAVLGQPMAISAGSDIG